MKKTESNNSSTTKGKVDLDTSSERVLEYLGQSDATLASPDAVDSAAAAFVLEIQSSIEHEVKELRSQGKYPPSLIARVNSYYNSLLPLGAASAAKDFKEAFWIADRVAYIDIDVPTASKKPGVSLVKRILRLMIAWYLNYVAQQFNNFTSNLMRLITIIDQRIVTLEEKLEATDFRHLELLDKTASIEVLAVFAESIGELVGDSSGRILVAECGTGEMLEELRRKGVDVYGIDERAALLDSLETRRFDVRDSTTLFHLHKLEDSVLSGLIVAGIVDRGTIAERVKLLHEAKRVMGQGSTLVLACSGITRYADASNHMEYDLSLGRPFSPDTWIELLKRLEFSHVRSISSETSDDYLVVASNTKASSGGLTYSSFDEANVNLDEAR